MSAQAKILSFTFPTSTGNLNVTGVGFQPQFARLWYNQVSGAGTATGTGGGNGMMHAGGQGATYVVNDANGSEGRQRVTSSNCITVVNTAGTVIAAATYVSFGSDGFTINVGTAPAASFTVDVLCLRSDTLAVESGIITSNSSPITVSLAAELDLLWLFGNAQSQFTGNQGSHYESVAVSTSNRLTTGGVRRRSADGSGAVSGIDTTKAWRAIAGTDSVWDLTTLSSSQFVLTRESGSGGIHAIWVALRGIDVAIGTLTQPTATGTQTITTGMQPAAVVLLGGDTDSVGTYPTTGAEYVRGASDGIAQFAHWYGIISGSSPTPQGGRARSATRVLASYTQGTPTLNADAEIDALLSDGFRLDWINVDSTARVVGWLALGTAVDVLTASDLTTGAPVLGQPSLSQTHALAGVGIVTGAPALGAPALGQTHALSGANLIAGAPTLGAPALEQTHTLIGADLVAGVPDLSAPALEQTHTLAGTNITTDAPVLGTPVLQSGTTYALSVDDLLLGTPVLGVPALSQVHAISGESIVAGVPVLGTPTLGIPAGAVGRLRITPTTTPPAIAAAAIPPGVTAVVTPPSITATGG